MGEKRYNISIPEGDAGWERCFIMAVLGQDLRFGFFDIPLKERLRAVKDAGIEQAVYVWEEENNRTGAPATEIFRLCEKQGLVTECVHYPQERAADLWREGIEGEDYTRNVIRAVKEAGEREIKHLVMHTTRRLTTPPPCETGTERMKRVLEEAEKQGVNIALENTRFLNYNRYLYEHCPSERLRFCFDCGHARCFTPGEDPLGMFGDRLVTTHLHDNDGTADQHRRPGLGTADWDEILGRLKMYPGVSLNLETEYSEADREEDISLEEYLARSAGYIRQHLLSLQ